MSKFLSLVLRHKPEEIGLNLDPQGWAKVDQLITLINRRGTELTFPLLEQIVATNDKQRFIFNEDKTKIRANQGHSIEVDLALQLQQPPNLLFHGTATRFLDSIRTQGLLRGSRQYVHLALDIQTATKVGQRHGKPAVLEVRAEAMHLDEHQFFCADNGVWLTEHVPSKYIEFPTGIS
ncbi:MAG: RNA 2'-phosphotransferase [Anaerolineae bacterium]|nr:RNA 2'-phosphotransferase [Gloeobacterales cyanobacterium ES-bin-313]